MKIGTGSRELSPEMSFYTKPEPSTNISIIMNLKIWYLTEVSSFDTKYDSKLY